jgi:hypothetical protein
MPTRTNIKPGPSALDLMMENILETQEALKQKERKQGKEMESLEQKVESLKREMRPSLLHSTDVKDSILGTVKENEDPEVTSTLIVRMKNIKIKQNILIQEHAKQEEERNFLSQKLDVLRQSIDHMKMHRVVKDSDLEIIGDNEDPDDEEDGMSMDTSRSYMHDSQPPSTKKKHGGSVPSCKSFDHLKKHRIIDNSGVSHEEDSMSIRSMDTSRSYMHDSQPPSTKKQHAGLAPSWKAMGSK